MLKKSPVYNAIGLGTQTITALIAGHINLFYSNL